MNSVSGCVQISQSNYWFFLKDLKYPLGIIGLVIGLIIWLAGRLFLKYVIIFMVPVSMISISVCVGYALLDESEATEEFRLAHSYINWLLLGISGVLGFLVAWAFQNNRVLMTLPMSGWLGFEIGLCLSNLLYFNMQNVFLFWTIIVMGSITTMIIASANVNQHMIWVTACLGSYLFIQSISVFVGRWPIDINLPEL